MSTNTSNANLTQPDFRALEQARRQLTHLTTHLNSLHNSLHATPTLPPLDSLALQANFLTKNLQTICQILDGREDGGSGRDGGGSGDGSPYVFGQLVAYPSTNFPGRDPIKEGVLGTLLRKKVEVEVEGWVAEGRKAGAPSSSESPPDSSPGAEQQDGMDTKDTEEVWTEVREWFQERVAKYALTEAGGTYTQEEEERGVERVNTGNKRDYEEYESEGEDGDGGEGMGKDGGKGEGEKGVDVGELMRFWTRGVEEVGGGGRVDNSHLVRRKA